MKPLTSLSFIWSCINSLGFPFKKRYKELRENCEQTRKFTHTRMCTVSTEKFHAQIIFLFVQLVRGRVKMQLNSECYITENQLFAIRELVYFLKFFVSVSFVHLHKLFYILLNIAAAAHTSNYNMNRMYKIDIKLCIKDWNNKYWNLINQNKSENFFVLIGQFSIIQSFNFQSQCSMRSLILLMCNLYLLKNK